jgi:hypothetical protein
MPAPHGANLPATSDTRVYCIRQCCTVWGRFLLRFCLACRCRILSDMLDIFTLREEVTHRVGATCCNVTRARPITMSRPVIWCADQSHMIPKMAAPILNVSETLTDLLAEDKLVELWPDYPSLYNVLSTYFLDRGQRQQHWMRLWEKYTVQVCICNFYVNPFFCVYVLSQ